MQSPRSARPPSLPTTELRASPLLYRPPCPRFVFLITQPPLQSLLCCRPHPSLLPFTMTLPPRDRPVPLPAFLPPAPLRSFRRADLRPCRRLQQRPSMASGPEGRPPAPPPPRRSAARGGGGAAALAAGIISLAAVTSGGGGMGTAVLPSPPAARAEVMEATASAGSVLDPPMTSVATFTKGSALDAAEAAMAAADAAIAAAEAAATAADAATAAADAAMAAAASVPMAAHRAEVGIPPIAAPSVAAPEPTAVSAPSADALEPSAVAAPTSAAFKRTEVAVPAAVPAAAPATAESVDSRAPDDFSSAPTSVAPAVATAPAPTPPPLDKEHALLDEVWALIDRYYLTLRDAPAWADQRRKAASTPLGGSRTATYAAARRMLKTLGDPYTRLLTPDGMAALSKYDVTGLGLMLLPTKGGGGTRVLPRRRQSLQLPLLTGRRRRAAAAAAAAAMLPPPPRGCTWRRRRPRIHPLVWPVSAGLM